MIKKRIIFLVFLIFFTSCQGIKKDSKIEAKKGKKELVSYKKIIKVPNITIVYDNYGYKKGLEPAWGFSCLINLGDKKILFDTGWQKSIFLSNFGKLKINPGDIDIMVISHDHQDHTGGIEEILKRNKKVKLYTTESFPDYYREDGKKTGVKIGDPIEIVPGILSTGEMADIEQSLIINTKKGMIIITGCAHPGIVEIIKKAKSLINNKVLFVMGGFHLFNNVDEIDEVISQFKKLKVKYVAPCHCSGDETREQFKKVYGKNYIEVGVGREITKKDLDS